MSGESSLEGKKALELLIETDNAAGGWDIGGEKYQVALKSYDNGNSQQQENAAVNKLIYEDKVNVIFSDGGFQDGWTPTAEKEKMLSFIGPTQTNMPLKPEYHYFFSVSFVSSQLQTFTGWFASMHPDVKNTLVRAFPDNQLGHILSGLTGAMWQSFGVTPQDVFYPAGTTDLSSVATKVISLKPQYFTTMNGGDSADAQLFNALAQGGFTGTMFTASQPSAITLSKIMSPEALTGFVCSASPTEFDPAATPQAQAFKDLWVKKYGDWQEPNISSFVNDYMAYKAAATQAKSIDSTTLADLMSKGMTYESLNGAARMVGRPDLLNDRTVDSVSTFFFKEIKDGKPVMVGKADPEQALQYIRQGTVAPPPGGAPPGGPPPSGAPAGAPPGGSTPTSTP